MKKEYTTPSMEVITLQQATAILAGSGYDDEINAPEFNIDDMQEMQSLLFGE